MFKRQGSLQILALYFIMREDTISSQTYKDAGVDITAGNALVEAIKPLARSTSRSGADAKLGGFGGIFDLAATGYDDPILVASTDGVGTKLQVAIATGRHRGVGIDLVAMCVNDLLVQGAEPLFFLDYYACARLDAGVAKDIIAGIAEGCHLAGCALIGGETAEMPGMYAGEDYDLAGFAVGVVEKEDIIDPQQVEIGDCLIGLAASGPHSNGYSLIRKIIEMSDADLNQTFAGSTLGEALLTPTIIYVKAIQALAGVADIKAIAHITGGGFYIKRAGGVVIQEKQRFGTADDEIVDAHRHQIDTDGVVPVQAHGQGELGTNAIGGRYQHRMSIFFRDLTEGAEAA